ncbi:glycoside hydrolase family 16 protein [Stemphylium lycopersici]|uniref:Glycoside hydrolase family 16 protein n=1 Tax=Stemphylium lycopersici TaxID=183478 RepID=A0A364N287_STELY|nr:glycoside hydrolase family 16 protein [Stemphylium lycopersici]RAR09927.1 glycoside hydrolase family 16 protein [Stemphylium lycopersici]
MVRSVLSAAVAAVAFTGLAIAQVYGDCGVGAFCLGGCDPLMSHSFDSCVPGPVCKSGTYKLDSLDDVQTIDKYLGDASKINWQSQGMPIEYTDPKTKEKATLLTMAQGTVGTLLASTYYVWYGKICSKLSTAQGKGVVTAFILMSDVKDEIDFEWVGSNRLYVFPDVRLPYSKTDPETDDNGEDLKVPGGNTVDTMHEYCVDWKEDTLTWSIDGKEMRSLDRESTWNDTSGRYSFPQTPARIMLSLWPAGLPSNAKGTVEWAGGEIDWNSPYMNNGYYAARFSEVTVECYDPPPAAQIKGKKTYKYTDEAGTNNTVAITDDEVILGSLMGTGENPGEADKDDDKSKPSQSVAMVPGGNPGGGAGREVAETSTLAQQNPNVQATGESSGNGATSQGQFIQGGTSGSTGAGAVVQPALKQMGGSVFAVVLAIFGLMVL